MSGAAATIRIVRLDDAPPKRPVPVRDLPAPLPTKAFHGDTVLACAACRQWITAARMRIEVAGAHEHERENPSGIRFRFGCFVAARGLVLLGEPTSEATWFPGWSWQAEACARCAEHLGWRFACADGSFHALIRDRLVELILET